jgi:ATP-dependent helicase/DNAse subunit B
MPDGEEPEPSVRNNPAPAGRLTVSSRELVFVPQNGKDHLPGGKPLLSASQIETYLECPLKWFSLRRLRLQDSDAGFGAMEMGTFAHKVLEVTHGTLLAEALAKVESSGAPVPDVEADPSLRVSGSRVSPDDPELIAHAKEILSNELDLHLRHQFIREGKRSRYQAFVPHNLEERDLLRVLKRDLCSVIDYEADLFAGYEPRFFELDFGHGGDLVEYAGVWINGTVDRIDVDAHGNALVIDYKHKSSSGFMGEYGALPADGPDGELVLPRHVQSLVYGQVVRRSYPDLKVKGALYLSTRGEQHTLSGAVDENQADRVFGSHLPGTRSRSQVSVAPGSSFGVDGESGMDALLDATERAIAEKVAEMLDGRIGANPRDAAACSYCPVNNCEKRISK